MSVLKEREIARRLASLEAPEPPPDLLEKLRAEIPPHFDLAPEDSAEVSIGAPEPVVGRGWSRYWPIAATFAIALGGGFLAFEVQRQSAPSGLPQPVLGDSEESKQETIGSLRRVPGTTQPADPVGLADPAESPDPRGEADRVAARSDAEEFRSAPRQLSAPPESPATPGVSDPRVSVPGPDPSPPPPVLSRDFLEEAAVPSGTFDDEISVQGEAPEIAVTSAISSSMATNRRWRRKAKRDVAAELSEPRAARPQPSTGGMAEPNDQPYGDVFFRPTGTNPFIDTEEDHLSTFGLDVDTGSYTIGRRYLRDGNLPPAESIRVEEWVNAFDYGDRPSMRGDFALLAEGSPTPFAGPRYRLLRLAVRGRTVEAGNRKPAVLTFVVDVSGSMDRENRLALVKKSLGLLLGELRSSDRIALVVFGSRGEVLLEPSSDHERIRSAIDRLQPGGSTNAEEGLALGYQLASRFFLEGGINRVILCSDGVANVGRTGPESILRRIRQEAERGIELTTLGFGMGNYNDVLMEQLADQGDGRYAYLDTLEEARRVLVEDLTGTLQTIASEVRAQVDFNPKTVERYRLLGYENREIPDERFRDDTVDAGEVGAGHTVTALYEIKLRRGDLVEERLATLHLRFRSAATGSFEELSREIRETDLAPSWKRASPSLRLASLVAEMAEILKGSYWAKGGSLDRVFRLAQGLSPEFAGDERVAEFAALAGKATRLRRQEER